MRKEFYSKREIPLFGTNRKKVFAKILHIFRPKPRKILVKKEVKLVGIDYLSVEKFGSEDFANAYYFARKRSRDYRRLGFARSFRRRLRIDLFAAKIYRRRRRRRTGADDFKGEKTENRAWQVGKINGRKT